MKNLILLFLLANTYLSFAQDTTAIQSKVDTLITIDTVQALDSVINNNIITITSAASVDTALVNSLSTKKRKITIDRIRIMFGLDFSPFTPLAIESDVFNGSYYPVKDSSPVWAERNTKTNLSKKYRTSNIQFFLQANVWKGLFVGMNYNFFTVGSYKKDPNLGNLLSKKSTMFFMVTANIGYVFEFLKNKCLQIQPSIKIGGYTADDYYDSGVGKKLNLGADVKIRYLIKRKAGFSLGVNYDYLFYKKKGFSDIFQRDTYQKTTFNNISLNIGFVYNVTINTHKK